MNERIETLRMNLENQLEFIEGLLPDKHLINLDMVEEQLDQASFYVTDLMALNQDTKKYESKINKLKESYGIK